MVLGSIQVGCPDIKMCSSHWAQYKTTFFQKQFSDASFKKDAFFYTCFVSRFPPFLRFPRFQTFDPKRHFCLFSASFCLAGLDPKCIMDFKEIYEELEQMLSWLCMCEQFFVFFVGRSSNDIARFNRSCCKCRQVAMKLIDMDPISQLQTFAWYPSCRCEVAGPLLGQTINSWRKSRDNFLFG